MESDFLSDALTARPRLLLIINDYDRIPNLQIVWIETSLQQQSNRVFNLSIYSLFPYNEKILN